MKAVKHTLMIGCVVTAALVLAACREDEKDRALSYDKGNYSGKPDAPLSADARMEIQDRVRLQSGLDTPGGNNPSISAVSSATDVRPPSSAAQGSN